MELDNLIFDRTQADVNRVKTLTQKLIAGTATGAEKSEWLAGMKGAYNASDLNRVGSAVEYLTDTLYSMGYNVPTVPKDDWTKTDIPTQTQMTRYIENIHTLRDHLPYVAPDAPESATGLDYQKANNIEEILYTLEQVLIAMQENSKLRQANTFFMTSGGVLQ
ncbi:MAG TPA: hypothetical protein H9707_09025 [Candidatus Butyricicoccus avicola]|nr:hypothetical protein [Candidatus Butyricicoccus avicola]